ncbi:MAG TPA: M15 family metallopeptidase [Chryseolinea sp.]|nr:M15 family metallopeptidase [Chryseolinea sp.]
MHPSLKVAFAIVLSCSCTVAFAQTSALFRSYDCREHGEPVVEEITQDFLQILKDSITAAVTRSIVDIEPEPLFIEVDTIDGWKSWAFVENFAFGKNRGDLPMITDLNSLHPFFRDRIIELIDACRQKGIELAIVETYRTPSKQHEYKTMGKKYTSSGAGRSKHQYGLAIDLVPIVDSVAIWDNAALWRKIGVTGEKLGLRWGGRWKKPYDPGHFEWTGGASTYNLVAGGFPQVPNMEHYPCLDEDLRILRRYWSEWEVSQSSLTRK